MFWEAYDNLYHFHCHESLIFDSEAKILGNDNNWGNLLKRI